MNSPRYLFCVARERKEYNDTLQSSPPPYITERKTGKSRVSIFFVISAIRVYFPALSMKRQMLFH